MVSHFEFQHQLSSFGLSPTARANQTTANVCRAVNVIFSNQFIEELKKVNDKKSRQITSLGIPTIISGYGRQWCITTGRMTM